MLLIKNVEVFAPEYIGRKDVLVCQGRVEAIRDKIEGIDAVSLGCETIDGEGQYLTPGILDQHVHITGGGGEGSFHTRTPEVQLSELIEGGVTTVVGLLGTDGMTRSVENLYAKTAALKEEGVSAYMLTGAYGNPGPTITGEPDRDVVFIREILGLKLALSDHRAPNVTVDELTQIASKIRVAGMMSGKAGIVVLHMGDAPSGLIPVYEVLKRSAVPIRVFRPTHVNRNDRLLEEGFEFLRQGGYVDYTCGMKGRPSPGACILQAKQRGIDTAHITMSSDGHGSWSEYAEDGTLLKIGVSGVDSLFRELVSMVKELGFALEEALPYVTSQVAEALGIFPQKGCIREGADADFLLLSKDLELSGVIAGGTVLMEGGLVKRRGTYEPE